MLQHQQIQSVAHYDLGMYLRSLKTQIKIMECYGLKLKECRGFVRVPGLSEFLSGDSSYFFFGNFQAPPTPPTRVKDNNWAGGEDDSKTCTFAMSDVFTSPYVPTEQ